MTIRELSKGTGLVQGTLYYWFGDKTNIICESAEYGLKKSPTKYSIMFFCEYERPARFLFRVASAR
ncbi:MAG: hypothetical protein L6V93_13860 [Clostridiales bacterium]|nr:MAG: hypothetical protein L6V93_13860 [Clostridiales bacterium]